MAKIRRTSDLIPGRYFVGFGADGGKNFHDLSADDLRKYVDGTNRMIAKGWEPPFLLEHAPPNSPEGSPVNKSKWDDKANKVRNGAGWVKRALINENGQMGYEIDVRDEQVAKGLNDGSIKFTSPELRKQFVTGDGEVIPYVLAHVAATHTPRNPQQATSETIAMAMQFSIEEMEKDDAVLASDEDKMGDGEAEAGKDGSNEDESKETPEKEVSEDSGVVAISMHQSVYDSLIGMLKNKGLALPDDVTPETFGPAMLAAMSGVNADASDATVVEESPPVQYSLDSINDARLPKLLSRAIKTEAESIRNGIKSIKIPGLQKALEKHTGTMQFSADAEELPTLTLGQVVKAVNDSIPEALNKLLTNNAEQFSVADHPDNEFLNGGTISKERAVQIVDEQAKHVPLIRR